MSSAPPSYALVMYSETGKQIYRFRMMADGPNAFVVPEGIFEAKSTGVMVRWEIVDADGKVRFSGGRDGPLLALEDALRRNRAAGRVANYPWGV